MEKTTSVNNYFASLPTIVMQWRVVYKGRDCGVVRATTHNVALSYISEDRYPERDKIELEYDGMVGVC